MTLIYILKLSRYVIPNLKMQLNDIVKKANDKNLMVKRNMICF